MILIIDNGLNSHFIDYYIKQNQKSTKIINSKDLNLDNLEKISIDGIIISNGPENRHNINNCIKVIERFAWRVPILGIGLGAVAVGVVFNAKLIDTRLANIEPFEITCDKRTIYNGVSTSFMVSKWCKYAISKELFNKTDLEISAESKNEIVSFRHKNLAIEGVLFDIPSFNCKYRENIFKNFITYYLK